MVTSPEEPASASQQAQQSKVFSAFLWAAVGIALFLIVHNYGLSLLPRVALSLDPAAIQAERGHAFAVEFDHSPGSTFLNPRSRVVLTEDGRPMQMKFHVPNLVRSEGEGSWSHIPGRIIFSTPDGSDPRTNGRHYVAHSPLLYSRGAGYGAIVMLVVASLGLRAAAREVNASRSTAATCQGQDAGGGKNETQCDAGQATRPAKAGALRWHGLAAALVFLAGLYCATGTLAPYANTMLSNPDKVTGYLYNIDHEVHRTLVSFVDGQPRETWQDSIMLRRIAYPVLSWPWMKGFGYETGGVLFNLCINLGGFALGVLMVRRHVGERGAIFAAWLMAVYPGAAYWAGQPYMYALIFPLGIAAFWLLLELPNARGARLAWMSLALGGIYLSYDFHAYFLPASVLLLLWHRRFGAVVVSAAIQVAPLGLWLWTIKNVIHLSLENSNTMVYQAVIESFLGPGALAASLQRLTALPEVAMDVFCGANFLFLPLLAIAAWAMDFKWRDFTHHRAVLVLLAAGGGLFAFCNIPPPHSGPWNLSGLWISRLYQPLFPALVLSLAWWWQELVPRTGRGRMVRVGLVGGVLVGNALICFAPVAGLPVRVPETAFYRFYDHTELHWAYEHNLRVFGRRPIGFPQAPASEPGH